MYKPLSILCISAHPDDEIGGAGGTLIKFVKNGDKVTLVLLTSGEEPDTVSSRVRSDERVREFQAVARELGAAAEVLNFPRYFQFSGEAIFPLVRIIRKVRPEVVLAPSELEEHPEHVMTSRVAREACRVSRRNKLLTLGEPWTVEEFREYELDNAFPTFDQLVDITEVVDEKARLFRFYASQANNKDYVAAFLGLNRYRAISKRTGRYAEAFRTTRVL